MQRDLRDLDPVSLKLARLGDDNHIADPSPEGGDRHVHVAGIILGGQRASDPSRGGPRLHHADHGIKLLVDHDVFAERITRGKELLGGFVCQDTIVPLIVEIGVGEKPALVELQTGHFSIVGSAAHQSTFEAARLVAEFLSQHADRQRFGDRGNGRHQPHVVTPRESVAAILDVVAGGFDRPHDDVERSEAGDLFLGALPIPSPIASSQITLATPMKMPSTVSAERSGCRSTLLMLSWMSATTSTG